MEILTLQFGHFANHTGAHYWNLQDELAAAEESQHDSGPDDQPKLDFERLYTRAEHRQGLTTWRPRLLAVDLKGALGACRPGDGWRPEASPAGLAPLWDFGCENHEAEQWEKHSFQKDLEQNEPQGWDGHPDTMEFDGSDAGDVEASDGAADAMRWDPMPKGSCGGSAPSAVRSAAEYNFRSTARSWTDYLKVVIPPSSIHELEDFHHGVAPFLTYFDGLQVRGRAAEEALLDLARRQLELCDQLDATQVLIDMHNGFGGVAHTVVRWLGEEQPKCAQLVLGLQPPMPSDGSNGTGGAADPPPDGARVAAADLEACAWLSSAFSFAGLQQSGITAWTPITVPLWSAATPPALYGLHRDSAYETSALVAAALETATLPCRVQGGLRPAAFAGALTPAHRPACGLLQALPLPAAPLPVPGKLPACENLPGLGQHFFNLSATQVDFRNPYTSVVMRGVTPRRLLELCGTLLPQARSLSFAHSAPLTLPVPFPQFFSPCVSAGGAYSPAPRGAAAAAASPPRPADAEVEMCPTATQLHAVAGSGRCAPLACMLRAAKAHRRSRWGALLRASYGIEVDEFTDVLEAITEQFESGAASGSEESGGG